MVNLGSSRPPAWHHVGVKKAAKPTKPKNKPAAGRKLSRVELVDMVREEMLELPPNKKTSPAKKPPPRADLGAPVDGFFAKQPPQLRAILDELRKLVDEAAPDATSSLKWGMPFYTVGGETMCALAGFKAHVNLILAGPPGTFADPDGLLEGDGKTGRHLKLRALDELPRAAVRGWLRTAAARARKAK